MPLNRSQTQVDTEIAFARVSGLPVRLGDVPRQVHVRFTIEGRVTGHSGGQSEITTNDGDRVWVEDGFPVTVLAEPEPEWVTGDVIRFVTLAGATRSLLRTEPDDGTGMVWVADRNHPVKAEAVSRAWREGRITVLHKN